MDKNKQILETLRIQPLSESEKASRHILGRLYGPIATSNEKTRNGRRYNAELWEKALADEVFNEKIAKKCLFLELGHPLDREETIMEKVCACIPECPKIVDGDLYAYVDILDTPNGKILKTLCDYGFVPGISSRGSGDIMANDEVDPETFFLETWDIVALPAVKKARLTVCESLDQNELRLRKALTESYNAASVEEKLVMKEALDNLDLSLDFPEPTKDVDEFEYEDPETGNTLVEDDKEETVEVEETKTEEAADVTFTADEVKEVATDVATEVTDCGKDDADCQEAITDVVNDTVDKAVEAKLENEQTENSSVEDKEAEPIEDDVKEVSDSSEEAIDDGTDEVLENLKKLIRQKGLLEGEIKTLKSEKAVSDAEVRNLKEELNKYKTGFTRMSELAANSSKFEKEVQKLNEQLTQKDKLIQDLQDRPVETVKLTESVNAHDSKVKSLTEKLDAMQKDLTASENKLNEQKSQYKSKLTEAVGIAKTYKSKYDTVMSKYIETRASMLGVKPATIVNELNENYSIEDVDKVCEELLESNVRYNNLPIGLNANTRIRFNESKSNTKKQSSYVDGGYEIDDSLLELAGLKK